MKIIVADDLPASALELLRSEGWDVDARSGRPAPELAADLADADALVVRSATKVTADLIAAAPTLRAIARAGTGVDNVDVEAASARGIVVMNAPGRQQHQRRGTGDGAAAGTCPKDSRRRRVDEAGQVGQEEFSRRRSARQDARPRRPRPHRPGSGAARARVRDDASSRTTRSSARRSRATSASSSCRSTSCAQRADFLSLHMPSTPQTRHIFNAERLAPVQEGPSHHQHRARRPDRRDALWPTRFETGHIGGAALDVFEQEPTTDHRCRSCRRSSPRRTSRPPRARDRNWWASRPRSALRDFLKTRHHSQRRQFSVAGAGRVPAAAAVCRRSPASSGAARADGRRAHRRLSASATTASWRGRRTR